MEIRPLGAGDAEQIASWRYPGRYSTYDFAAVHEVGPDHWAVTDAGELIGYCCFGAPARVPGAEERSGTLDIGYGMSPERMGRGSGRTFGATILKFAAERFRARRFRLYVLEWNQRSRKVAEGLGFGVDSVLENDEGAFLVMVREVE